MPAPTSIITRTVWFSLSDLRQAETVLRFPFVEPPAAVSDGELEAALGPDEFDVVRAFARAFDEALLLLVPLELAPLAVPCRGIVAGEIECDVARLLGEGGAVAERVPAMRGSKSSAQI